jgi:K+-sensing histidine kinase KdpD
VPPNLQSQRAHSAVLRYGLAVTSFASALGLAILVRRYGFRDVEVPLFLFAIAIPVWYAGIGPAILAVVLSGLAFDYFFTLPRYSFSISRSEFPYYAVFILFALLLTWFSAVRRHVERQLLQSRDALQREVVKRTEQASLLNLTHDTIFVRDMSDIISYWNRGTEEPRSCTDGGQRRQSASTVTNSCRRLFRYCHSFSTSGRTQVFSKSAWVGA